MSENTFHWKYDLIFFSVEQLIFDDTSFPVVSWIDFIQNFENV